MALSRASIAIGGCVFALLLVACDAPTRSILPVSEVRLHSAPPSAALPNWRGWLFTLGGQGELWAVNPATGKKHVLRRGVIASPFYHSGHWLAWMNAQTPPNGPRQLYVLDLTTGKTRCLPTAVWVAGLAIDRDKLCVQEEVSDTATRVFVADLRSDTTTYVGNGGQVLNDPALAGRWIAWRDDRSQTTVVYDTITRAQLRLHCGDDAPLLSGSWLVWPASSHTIGLQQGSIIRARNLVTGRTVAVTDFAIAGLNDQAIAALHAPWLVWLGRKAALRATNLTSGEQRLLAPGDSGADTALFVGDWIVWHSLSGNTGIVAYNLRTRQERRLGGGGTIDAPRLVGSWVVWDDGRSEEGIQYHARNLVTGATRDFFLSYK